MCHRAQGKINLALILPVGCDRPLKPYQRLVIEGVVPVLIVTFVAAFTVVRGITKHLHGESPSKGRSSKRQRSKRGRESTQGKHLTTTIMNELGNALPFLLPFSYLCSTSIATQAFSAFDCHSFELDEADSDAVRSYLVSDLRVRCDPNDADYATLQRTAIVLIACVTALPFIYFALVFKARSAILSHSHTKLSRGCRFLWAEYKKDSWWFETLQQLRKLFLTGYVMLFDKRHPNTRLLAAIVVTFTFRELTGFRDPYRDATGSALFNLQQMLLVVVLLTGVLVRLCDDPDNGTEMCSSFGFQDSFGVSMLTVVWNLFLFSTIVVLIVLKAYQQVNKTTLRLKNGKEPLLTLHPEHRYHTFVSHIWSTGQDQAAVIKRQLQHLLPMSKVFLDVDDLVEIGDLEGYVQSTSCMLLFLSKGYFRSGKCVLSLLEPHAGTQTMVG